MPIVAPPSGIHPSYLTWLGLSHEVAQGTPALNGGGTPVGPVWNLPLEASTFDPEDKPMWLRDIGIRGSMADVFAIIQGVEDSAWSLGGPVYEGVTPVLMDNMFGDLTTTVTGGTAGSPTTSTGGGYVLGTSGLSLPAASVAGFTAAGQWGLITSGSQSEAFLTTAAGAAGAIPIQSPLHFSYPAAAVITPYPLGTPPTYATHKFAALNAGTGQPPSWTLLDSTGVIDTLNGTPVTDADQFGQRFYTSMCLAQLDFTLSAEGLFTQKASGTAWASTATNTATAAGGLASPATSAFAPANVTALPIPSWSSNIKLTLPDAAFGAVNYVGEITFSLKRKIQVYWTDDGVQSPYVIARGPLAVTGTVKAVVAQDEQILKSMLKNFQGRLQALVIFPTGSGPAFPPTALQGLTSFQFDLAQCAFTAAKPTRSSVLVGYDSTFEGVANTTNVGASGGLGPITMTVIDTNPGY